MTNIKYNLHWHRSTQTRKNLARFAVKAVIFYLTVFSVIFILLAL